MIKNQKGELIHSWIHRSQKAIGEFRLNNIIGSKGHWLSFPKLHKGMLDQYQTLDEKLILKLLAEIGAISKTNSMFSPPNSNDYYLLQFLGMWGKATAHKSVTQPIKYCLDCIHEAIKNLGYGYFKVEWYYKSHCDIHDSSLFICLDTERSQAE